MNEIVKYETPKSIDRRRAMANDREIITALNTTEREVLTASTNKPISEMSPDDYVRKAAQLFRYIAIDTGYIIPRDGQTWQYLVTRLSDIIKKYFGQLTINEIKLAFELLVTGELNAYLPKDNAGNPDNKHYQQFNAEYFSKVLNAYIKKQNDVVAKCYKIVEQRPALPTNNDAYYNAEIEKKNKACFENYKKTGVLELYVGGELFVWDWLHHAGLVDGPEITPEERNAASKRIIQLVRTGLMSIYTAHYALNHKDESKEIGDIAFVMAKKREIKNAFDRIIKDNINIKKYI